MTLNEEIARRRTFAVIAHPDAGKTTLTEKLLLFYSKIKSVIRKPSKKENLRHRWLHCQILSTFKGHNNTSSTPSLLECRRGRNTSYSFYESNITLIAKSGKDTKTTTAKTYRLIFFMNIHAKILSKISGNWIQHIKSITHNNKMDLLPEFNNSSTYKNWSV